MTYTNATLLASYGAPQYPKTGNALYNFTLTVAPNGISWVVLATPASVQVGSGALALDNTGQRCWNQANDTGCDLGNAAQAWTTN